MAKIFRVGLKNRVPSETKPVFNCSWKLMPTKFGMKVSEVTHATQDVDRCQTMTQTAMQHVGGDGHLRFYSPRTDLSEMAVGV